MAVASPVLERKVKTEEREETGYNYTSVMTADEVHNSRIRENYAKLINPETKPSDVFDRSSAPEAVVSATPVIERESIAQRRPYFVEPARTNAEIFRADSAVNQRAAVDPKIMLAQDSDDEENEDLRPTSTTIQYKTLGVKQAVEEGKIVNSGSEKRLRLNKKEKIAIAVVVSVIVALFALIIINSAIITNLDSNLTYLQSSLTTAKAAFSSISDQVEQASNISLDAIKEFAENHGGVFVEMLP